jgi:Flp pilus assembly pilin Flp
MARSPRPDPAARRIRPVEDEAGSLVTEYGLLAVVGATVASLVVKWASGGAIFELFGALTKKVRVLIGA